MEINGGGDILGKGKGAQPFNPFRRRSTRAAESSRSREKVSKKSEREERMERTCWSTSIEVIFSCTWRSSETSSTSSLGRLWLVEGNEPGTLAESKEMGLCGSKAAVWEALVLGGPVSRPEKDRKKTGTRTAKDRTAVRFFHF